MRTLLLLFLTLASVNIGFSQEIPTKFTLEEAIAFALENNYSSINAVRDTLDARKLKWETIAEGLPQISGNINYQNQLKQPVSLIPGEFFGGDPGTYVPITFGQPQQATATATLKQQIFDGSYIVGVQATKTFLNYSRNNFEKTSQEVREAVVEAYGNMLLATQTADILKKNLENIDKTLYETEKLYENGLGDEESVEQLQITRAQLDNELKNAIRYETITLQMLNLTMGLPLSHPTEPTENLDELVQNQIDLSLMNSDFMLENNIDWKLAFNLNEQRYYELKLAKSRALPTLDAFVNYGSSSFSDKFNFLNGETEWYDSSILGFELNIPIFSSLKRSASTQRAKIALEKAKTQLTEAEQRIRLQLDQAKSNYSFSIEQYDTSKKNLNLAERIETKNQIKYQEGLATSFELRQAQLQLYTSQQEYLQSMVEVINSKVALENILNN